MQSKCAVRNSSLSIFNYFCWIHDDLIVTLVHMHRGLTCMYSSYAWLGIIVSMLDGVSDIICIVWFIVISCIGKRREYQTAINTAY